MRNTINLPSLYKLGAPKNRKPFDEQKRKKKKRKKKKKKYIYIYIFLNKYFIVTWKRGETKELGQILSQSKAYKIEKGKFKIEIGLV